jgi:hypothetical protein
MSTNNTTNKNGSGSRNSNNSNNNKTNTDTAPNFAPVEWPKTTTSVDPKTILWYKLLEDSRTDGLPKVAEVDLELVDALWQLNSIRPKRKYRRHSSHGMTGCW